MTVILAAGAVLVAQQPHAADQTPVFRAGTDVVQVDVSVLDRRRQPVRNLTVADFTVLENGQPRPIVSFTEVTLPPADAPVPVRPDTDVATNAIGNQEGRLVIVLLDRSIAPGWPWAWPSGWRRPPSNSSVPTTSVPSSPGTAPART